MIPYKSKQLLYHILFGFTEEQFNTADGFLKELLFKNIGLKEMENELDRDTERGGAGWDKRKASSFSDRVQEIIWQANLVKQSPERSPEIMADYLDNMFNLELDNTLKRRMVYFLQKRILNGVDCYGLKKEFDLSRIAGGLGLYSGTAERIIREVEIIMLLSYSPI